MRDAMQVLPKALRPTKRPGAPGPGVLTKLAALPKVIALSGALALTACAVGPDFVRPESQSPQDWNQWRTSVPTDAEPASQPTADEIDRQWWTLFSDSTLNVLEARVVAANLDIRVASLRLAQSRAQRNAVASGRAPSVSGNAAYQRERQSEVGASTRLIDIIGPPGGNRERVIDALTEPFNLYQVGFDASWELDLWGRVRRSVEAADAATLASREAVRDVQLTVMAELARNYLELRGIQRQLAIAQQDVQTSSEMLDLTEQRYSGGLVTDLDVTSQRALLSQGRSRIPQLQQQEAAAINRIALLLGERPGVLQSELAQAQPIPPAPPRVPIGVPSEVARRRPDIREAEARLHAATADIGVAVADLYPRFTLAGSFDLQSLDASNLSEWGARQWTVGPSLSIPIFEGGRRRATVELRESQQQEAAVNYQRVVLQAWHEIDNALTAYASEQRRHEELRAMVESSRAAYELANTRYQHGLTNFLIALDAQRTLLQAERDFADSTTAISTQLVALYKALGGGWCREEATQTDGTCVTL